MIKDKCVCGAKFVSKQKDWVKESNDHIDWLQAHRVCRENAGLGPSNLIEEAERSANIQYQLNTVSV